MLTETKLHWDGMKCYQAIICFGQSLRYQNEMCPIDLGSIFNYLIIQVLVFSIGHR
jgi:hypothetical protein